MDVEAAADEHGHSLKRGTGKGEDDLGGDGEDIKGDADEEDPLAFRAEGKFFGNMAC